jgi:alpha-L-fucosidase
MNKVKLAFLLSIITYVSYAQTLSDSLKKDWQIKHESKQSALKEFNQAKFGMFIHWGLYAQLAGEWEGEKAPGLSEWIMYHGKISKKDYNALAKQFNPVQFNAEKWVLVAKNAGMKYIVITSKHHDGFSMYNTKYSNYNIVRSTPFKKDPIDALYKACKKHGLRFGVYYSQIIDWWDGWDGGMYRADRKKTDLNKDNPMNTWDPNVTTREQYLTAKAYPQVKELIKKYPDMLEVWFDYWYEGDGDKYCTPAISYQFYKTLYDVSPKCLVSTRIGSGLGDFAAAGDNEILTDSKLDYWETPGTVNNTWGYSKFDYDWKTPQELLFWIVDIASKGGNYLLNIGPKADGTIPTKSIVLLSEVGKWMKVNGEAIYGTSKWKIAKEGTTQKEIKGTDTREQEGFHSNFTSADLWFTQKGNNLYVTGFTIANNKTITIQSLGAKNELAAGLAIKKVKLLGYEKPLVFKQKNNALEVQLPKGCATKYGFALKINLQKSVEL